MPAVKEVVVLRDTTVALPIISPAAYDVAFTGLLLSEAEVLANTRYSSAVVAVKEPAIEAGVTVPKTRFVGCAAGAVQGGNPAIVVACPVSTVPV